MMDDEWLAPSARPFSTQHSHRSSFIIHHFIVTETHGLNRDRLLQIDYYMRLTRTLEERLVALFRQAKVIGGLFRSLGQEGESVAAACALDYTQGDVVQPLIRNMGAILVA